MNYESSNGERISEVLLLPPHKKYYFLDDAKNRMRGCDEQLKNDSIL